MKTITLRATRALHAEGRAHEAGAELRLAPMAAGLVLDSGRAELVNEDDRQAITAARQADDRHRHAVEQRHATVGAISRGGWH
jgi:hypothetical protein